ncbi:ankyrin repeat domain-containing protein [Leptospira idonii]|uniref:Ankyrin repeat domain-containing protein n=1 Tax=Leptospira idonii TaxID=1193500 RepID=A0A4R9LZA4_9LEPT|nr:ankyrin repeat domain-containing protein [Leptospira idonii]TGN18951.1 ankyrin repeat domain-containing protein [Leptospira idonii]
MKQKFLSLLVLALTLGGCVVPPERTTSRSQNLYFQVAIGNSENVRNLLQRGYNPDLPEDTYDRMTPLMVASKEGHDEVVRVLLAFRANPNAKSRNGHTALMMAAYNRYPKVVKLLLDAGADPNIQSDAGHTALSEILLTEKEEIVHLLEEKGAK